jgi:hypothetical protein
MDLFRVIAVRFSGTLDGIPQGNDGKGDDMLIIM